MESGPSFPADRPRKSVCTRRARSWPCWCGPPGCTGPPGTSTDTLHLAWPVWKRRRELRRSSAGRIPAKTILPWECRACSLSHSLQICNQCRYRHLRKTRLMCVQSRRHGGLCPPKTNPPNWNVEHHKSVEFLSNFRM